MNSSFRQSRSIFWVLAILLIFVGIIPVLGESVNSLRVWVQYNPGQKNAVRNALERANGEFHYTFDNLDSFVITLPVKAIAAIENNPNVVSIEEDVPRYLYASNATEQFVSSLNILAGDATGPNGQTIPWGLDAVQARDVWDTNRDGVVDVGAPSGAGMTICIIDTGYYQDHVDLGAAVGGYSQVDSDGAWYRDGYGHGTHVAGTIAALNNTVGVVGVAPNVSLYIVKIFNDNGAWTLSSNLVAAINRCADNGANVISMSLGGDRSNGRENRAFRILNDAGILSIAAAGNDGNTAFSYPASYDSVVSVAAIDQSLNIADFSQQNSQVELSGPGVSVLSTVSFIDDSLFTVSGSSYAVGHIEFSGRGTANGPLVDGGFCDSVGSWAGAVVLCERGSISFYDKVNNVQSGGGDAAIIYNNEPGQFAGTLGDGSSSSIIGLSLSQADGQFLVSNRLGINGDLSSRFIWPISGYQSWNGTSMATPHVSAVAALVWSSNPSWTNNEIREALVQSAQDLGSPGRDSAFGYGLVKAVAALTYLGGGTIDNPPTVTIISPTNGSTFNTGESISFSGSANDDEDGDLSGSLAWVSNLDGEIGTGASFSGSLSDGNHTITASVSDSASNNGSDSVSITVGSVPVDNDPVVAITTPGSGASYDATELISFSGTATDDIDGNISANLVWTSSLDGPIGIGESFDTLLSVGVHTITAIVTDSGSNAGSDSITVHVTITGGGQLEVTVSSDNPVYFKGNTALITSIVSDGTDPVVGATVTVIISTPKGRTLRASGLTDANGSLTVSYKINTGRDGKGAYNVTSTATLGGYSDGVGIYSFDVE